MGDWPRLQETYDPEARYSIHPMELSRSRVTCLVSVNGKVGSETVSGEEFLGELASFIKLTQARKKGAPTEKMPLQGM